MPSFSSCWPTAAGVPPDQARASSASRESMASMSKRKALPMRGSALASSGQLLHSTTPTRWSWAPISYTSSVRCGARVTVRICPSAAATDEHTSSARAKPDSASRTSKPTGSDLVNIGQRQGQKHPQDKHQRHDDADKVIELLADGVSEGEDGRGTTVR